MHADAVPPQLIAVLVPDTNVAVAEPVAVCRISFANPALFFCQIGTLAFVVIRGWVTCLLANLEIAFTCLFGRQEGPSGQCTGGGVGMDIRIRRCVIGLSSFDDRAIDRRVIVISGGMTSSNGLSKVSMRDATGSNASSVSNIISTVCIRDISAVIVRKLLAAFFPDVRGALADSVELLIVDLVVDVCLGGVSSFQKLLELA